MSKTLQQMFSEPRKQVSKIIEDFLHQNGTILIHSGAGVGKTWFMNYLTHCLATGQDFLRWKISEPQSVMFFDGEVGHNILFDRFMMIERGSKVSMIPNKIKIASCDDFGGMMPNLSDPKEQYFYLEEIRNHNVIIYDNLLTCSRFLNDRDGDVSEWSRIQKFIINQKSRNKAQIVVHHSAKSGGQLGTVRRETIFDLRIELQKCRIKKPNNGFSIELYFHKHRHLYGGSEEPIYMSFETENIEHEVFGNCEVMRVTWKDLEQVWKEEIPIQMNKYGNKEVYVSDMFKIPKHHIKRIMIENDFIEKREEKTNGFLF